jgi:hypothetical protein
MKAILRVLPMAQAAAALLALGPQSAYAYVHIDLDHGVWSTHDNCGPVTLTPGGTDLLGFGVGWPQQPDPAITSALSSQYGTWSNAPATYTWAPNQNALNGTFKLDKYVAVDIHANWNAATTNWDATPDGESCLHGADTLFHYERAPTDTVNLDWIQLFTEWGDRGIGHGGNQTNRVDPLKEDDGMPFYWTLKEWGEHSSAAGVSFEDHPYNPHPEASPASGGISFIALLVTWEGDNRHDLTLQEYVTWGYTYVCVPEPTTLTLALVTGSILWVYRVGEKRRRGE